MSITYLFFGQLVAFVDNHRDRVEPFQGLYELTATKLEGLVKVFGVNSGRHGASLPNVECDRKEERPNNTPSPQLP